MQLATARAPQDRSLQEPGAQKLGAQDSGPQDLEGLFEALPMGVLLMDAEGNLRFHNRASREILGLSEGSGRGSSESLPTAAWHLPDKATLLSQEQRPMARALRGEEVCDELFFVQSFEPPRGRWVRVTASAIRDTQGFITSALVLFRDVTEGRLSRQTSALLSQVVEQIADAVLLTDRHGFIQYVNPAFETITGFSADDVRGRTPRILKAGQQDSSFYQRLWSEALAGRRFQATFANRKKTGEIYQVEETISPITDEAGNTSHFVTVIRDITQALNRQEQEVQLRLARQIQQKFYRAAPSVPGFDVAAAAYPAYETSGDYFDFIPLPSHRLCIAVGDVEGHGFGSALVMALTRAYVHSFAAMGLEVDQILTQVNRMLLDDLGTGCFVTLMLASLDLSSRSLVFAGAGHIPGYVLDPAGSTEHTLESGGPPLGLFPDVAYSANPSITLTSGQLLVLFTDGITESATPDGAEWGASGALDYLVTHRHRPAHHLVDGLYQEAVRFACHEPQKDDIASVIIKVNHADATMLG
ncbi:MAG TPA: SpoIIE family protein phosphatase [Candidatus Sulfotelmatobacter sp.]